MTPTTSCPSSSLPFYAAWPEPLPPGPTSQQPATRVLRRTSHATYCSSTLAECALAEIKARALSQGRRIDVDTDGHGAADTDGHVQPTRSRCSRHRPSRVVGSALILVALPLPAFAHSEYQKSRLNTVLLSRLRGPRSVTNWERSQWPIDTPTARALSYGSAPATCGTRHIRTAGCGVCTGQRPR